jgi:hypothetical protein
MGRIPPDEKHPRYHDWLQASIRHLKAKRKLETMSQIDPDYAAAHSEWLAAKTAYEAIVAAITQPTQTRLGSLHVGDDGLLGTSEHQLSLRAMVLYGALRNRHSASLPKTPFLPRRLVP